MIISWFTISVAFAFILGKSFLNLEEFSSFLPISFIAVGTAFIFHELAHRQVAKHFGCHAEFRAWKLGLIASIALPLLTMGRFLFAAPGAVYIYGPHVTRKQNGLISLAGPATNIVTAVLFFSFLIYSSFFISFDPYVLKLISTVVQINLFLAFFNLIPFPPLDGSKIINWDVKVWALFFFPLMYFFFVM